MHLKINSILALIIFALSLTCIDSCIKLLNSSWKPISLEERTKHADLVVAAKILYTTPIPKQLLFYSATFEVSSVLKGWDVLKELQKRNSKSILSLEPKLIISAKGFGDSRLCFSNVEVGESYALFLGFRRDSGELVAKYDDIFGAADLLYKRTEREILQSLGWDEWSPWTKCSKDCNTGTQQRTRECRTDAHKPCQGQNTEFRECNIFSCEGATNILSFILEHQDDKNHRPWLLSGETYSNELEQRAPVSNVPTFVLFSDEYPKGSVLHITFHGPVKETQYLYSVYDANNQLEFGIRLSPHAVDFVYSKRVNTGAVTLRSRQFAHVLNRDMWYSLALNINDRDIRTRINCEQVFASTLEDNIFQDFDIFGRMYLGSSTEKVKVEVGQITLVKDPKSLWQQCGKTVIGPDIGKKAENINKPSIAGSLAKEVVDEKTTEQPDESSGSGPVGGPVVVTAEPDDSEDGDVDEDNGSSGDDKEKEIITVTRCNCLNGGVCKKPGICTCPSGWTGEKCTTPICNNKCLNGGTCKKPNQCSCKKGTSGKFCQFMECQLPCKNGGMCIGPNVCKCKEGFEGLQCHKVQCSAECQNGGSCVDGNKCACMPGFKGDNCQHQEKCKKYVTRLVSHLKPALIYKYIYVREPCKEDKTKKCKVKRLKQGTINQVYYRPEYFCKT